MFNYKIAYVLTDDSTLKYYNQMMRSFVSLRYYMPDIEVCVLTDNDTYEILCKKECEILDKAEVKVIEVPAEINRSNRSKSRYIKVTLRQNVVGDVLFIDTDTIICRAFPDVISDKSIAAVLNQNTERDTSKPDSDTTFNTDKCCKVDLTDFRKYLNSGVIWSKDDDFAHYFYHKWHDRWNETRKNVFNDQPSFNFLIKRYIDTDNVEVLENIWNNQISSLVETPINSYFNAYIVHYLNVPAYSANNPYIFCDKDMQNLDYRDVRTIEIIKNHPANMLKCKLIRLDKETEYFYNSRQYKYLKKIYTNHKKLFSFNEKVLYRFRIITSKVFGIFRKR